jgi:large exoprotein involved in heme utilization and adhesion
VADNVVATGLFAATSGDGAGGSIRVAADRIRILDFGRIGASAVPEGAAVGGAGGDIVIDAGELLLTEGSTIAAATNGTGEGGSIAITASRAVRLESAVNAQSRITVETRAAGNGGSLTLVTPSLALDGNSAILASTTAAGNGGNLALGGGSLALTRGALISATATGTGTAGTIALDFADAITLTGGSSIATSTTGSDGGNIALAAGRLLYLEDSAITTSVAGGAGNGGNITLDVADGVAVLQRSQIIAQAFGGNGGNILIDAAGFVQSPDSLVDASSQLGINGDVRIAAPETDFGASLAPRAANFFDAESLLRSACAADSAMQNSLVLAGNGGLPPRPADAQLSTLGDLSPVALAALGGAPSFAACAAGSAAW